MPTLDQLKRRHPAHKANADHWQILDALLQGGSKLTPELKKKLLCNPDNRPAAIVDQRVKLARYFNKMGPIASRFLSQLFAAPLAFEGSKDKFWVDTFFPGGALLPAEDDDGRSSFIAFLKAAILAGLGSGKAIAQVDTAVASDTLTRAQQRQKREDEPYVLLVPRCDLWDWETDRNGFKFAKLHRFTWQRDTWDGDPVALHDFTIYQRQSDGKVTVSRYTVRHVDKGGTDFDKGMVSANIDAIADKDAQIETVNGLDGKELFNLRGQFKFPIITMTLPSALHLADQLHDPQVSHFNQTASLEYGLVANNYAMPTITSEDVEDFTSRNNKFGDGYFIHLDPSRNEAIGWTERPGGSFSTSMEYRRTIEEDIDKTVQQIALSAADAVTSTSGEAIRQARKPEEILLTTYGGFIKEFAKSILDCAAIAHNEEINWTVNGLDDFDVSDLTGESKEYTAIGQTKIPSETFTKEMQKTFVREVAKQKEFEPATLKKILKELEEAPPAPMATGEPDMGAPPPMEPPPDDGTGTGEDGGDGASADQLLTELGIA
ncbi:hypothetical protein [Pantanalinema sp. GBBB05]|uniref:hypothetical protein n=1 Tax=Pantanalinema sp. GBBB05 TaxID=2604139 RepID=UPI001DDCC9B4|nr:hypothetical protein [Pantanalinema sp. GBBB05]